MAATANLSPIKTINVQIAQITASFSQRNHILKQIGNVFEFEPNNLMSSIDVSTKIDVFIQAKKDELMVNDDAELRRRIYGSYRLESLEEKKTRGLAALDQVDQTIEFQHKLARLEELQKIKKQYKIDQQRLAEEVLRAYLVNDTISLVKQYIGE